MPSRLDVANCVLPLLTVLFCALLTAAEPVSTEIPREWIDAKTGHRVVRLSDQAGSASLYFHQNTFTPEGDKLLISTPRGLETVDLKSRELKVVVPRQSYRMGGSSGVEMGRKTRTVYFATRTREGTLVRATHVDSGETRDIVTLPFGASFNGVNADETLLFGALREFSPRDFSRERGRQRSSDRSMKLLTADIATGEIRMFHPAKAWLNHLQCSPKDPNFGLFCHEGAWHEVNRVWTIRFGSDDAKLMHRRGQRYEIAGHEFFSADGQWVWYDLQTPRADQFWLAGVDVKTGERIRYRLARNEWSVHYNISPDGKLFAGDGGGPESVANQTPLPEKRRLNPPGNGQWIYLFRPNGEFTVATVGGEPVESGTITSERLVDLSDHDYDLEPNVRFTPDGKWVVFRSNMHGQRHVYMVSVDREPQTVAETERSTWHFDFSKEPNARHQIPELTTHPDGRTTFAMELDEGNYAVTLRLGNHEHATSTTVKAEARRLMIENVETAAGQFVERSFAVNVRRSSIGNTDRVRLNARELGPPLHPRWDDLLTLEFSGSRPGVASMKIRRAPEAITVFIAGDSTVTDQSKEPYAGWGQMLPRFFGPTVAVANHAESGVALRSFEYQMRLKKVLSQMKPGDFMLIQFGHNDQKDPREEAGPFTTYKAKLVEFVDQVREKKGIPVLVTSMERLRMDQSGRQTPTLADYAEAVRQVGAEKGVPVIDLNAMSLKFYAALGPERATKAFAFYPAGTFPGQNEDLKDRTHHNSYGAYELARCVVEGLRSEVPALAEHLAGDISEFDPSQPDDPESFDLPPSPIVETPQKPAGN